MRLRELSPTLRRQNHVTYAIDYIYYEVALTEDDERDPGGEVLGPAEGWVVREALEGAAVVGGRGAELDVAAHLLAAVRRRAELGPVGVPRLPGLRPAEERPRPGRLCGIRDRTGVGWFYSLDHGHGLISQLMALYVK